MPEANQAVLPGILTISSFCMMCSHVRPQQKNRDCQEDAQATANFRVADFSNRAPLGPACEAAARKGAELKAEDEDPDDLDSNDVNAAPDPRRCPRHPSRVRPGGVGTVAECNKKKGGPKSEGFNMHYFIKVCDVFCLCLGIL